MSTPVNNRPTDKGMCPLQKGPIVTVTNDNSTKDYNVEKQYSFHDSFSEDSSLEDIAEHSRTGFYETQPSWMSNTTWCWHKADRDVTVGNNTIFDAENAQEIMLEESIAMKKGKHAVSRVREKYKHDISSLSPVDKQKIKKNSRVIDTLMSFDSNFNNIKNKKANDIIDVDMMDDASKNDSEIEMNSTKLCFTDKDVLSLSSDNESLSHECDSIEK